MQGETQKRDYYDDSPTFMKTNTPYSVSVGIHIIGSAGGSPHGRSIDWGPRLVIGRYGVASSLLVTRLEECCYW